MIVFGYPYFSVARIVVEKGGNPLPKKERKNYTAKMEV